MMNEPAEVARWPRRPSLVFRLLVLAGFGLIVAQLWQLQVIQGRELRQKSDANRIRIAKSAPPRGIVYDRSGRLVAVNSPVFVVSVVPADLTSGAEAPVLTRLASLLEMPPDEVRGIYERRRALSDPFTPAAIKFGADRRSVMAIEEQHLGLPGVVVSVEAKRSYPQSSLLSHLLGYTGALGPGTLGEAEYQRRLQAGYSAGERLGLAGVEKAYEGVLRGRGGRRMFEVDVNGREVRQLRLEAAQAGDNLVLTVDADFQERVEQILSDGLQHSAVGSAIVMKPGTGEVVAMVTLPNFDANAIGDEERQEELAALLKDPAKPFFNRATAGLYPPGSTFKLVTAAGALQEGLAGRDTVIESKGAIFVPHDLNPNYRERFPDWATLGKLDFVQAVAKSSNVYFFYLGGGYAEEGFEGLGHERLARYARLLGYGRPTGIDLPDEADGTIPDAEWKLRVKQQRWFKGDTYNMSIGQGYVQATPLQVANVTNAIANRGLVVQPRLLEREEDPQTQTARQIQPRVVRRLPIEQRHLELIIEGMQAAFDGPLLKDYRIPGLHVAAKTGTGEFFGELDALGQLPTHGWFTGFAPADNPDVSVTVFVQRGSGSTDAAPIAMRIFREYFGMPGQPTPLAPENGRLPTGP